MTNDSVEPYVEALRNTLKEVQALRQQNHQLAAALTEPVAIIGMACHYPGDADSPDALWRLLLDETDAISSFPHDRGWELDTLFDPDPHHHGTSYTHQGGFLSRADRFDASFFEISDLEALSMDPQQRLLLETAWESVEDARIDATTLRGSSTGVFIGSNAQEYPTLATERLGEVEGMIITGSATSIMSGRIAYHLGLTGPALTVDTACSSSLVALHQAVRSLRTQECDLALVGGATVMSTPTAFIEFSRQQALAGDGRCKPFAAASDGTGFAEGVGIVVVERLTDAVSRGHRIHAVIRGSAVNADGTSNGLTAPSGPAQQRVIRRALADARISAAEVDVVEAHGTGTELGDSVEAAALLATYGQERQAHEPLLLGTLKPNIGHTQASSGIASVIKIAQAMKAGVLPKTLHIDRPHPEVDWAGGHVELIDRTRKWPDTGHPRRAGITALGMSGTNAHVILEQQPSTEPDRAPGRTPPVLPWPVSGHSAAALGAQARRLTEHLDTRPAPHPTDLAWSLVHTRAAHTHRAVVVGSGLDDLRAGLAAVADAQPSASVVTGQPVAGGVGLVFTGPGSAPAGMGRELYEACPAYAKALDEICSHLGAETGTAVRAAVWGDRAPQPPGWTPLVELAFGVSYYRLLSSWGLRPSLVSGRGASRVTAAHVAGLLCLADAVRLAEAVESGSRSEVQQVLDGLSVAELEFPVPYVHAELRTAGFWFGTDTPPPDLWKQRDVATVVECGPASVEAGPGVTVLRAPAAEPMTAMTLLAQLYCRGVEIDWEAVFREAEPGTVDLPTYAFQRERYWLAESR
ncbi:type I polyketide synthase [Streptomyces xiamenensis]|uniref:type I polyketide synthase n=1 Tax=Streptomyces xiamenensis TaxID=408015 RepID=UPI0035DB9A42